MLLYSPLISTQPPRIKAVEDNLVREFWNALKRDHETILVVDKDYIICGSNNWLSNRKFQNKERSIELFDKDIGSLEPERRVEEIYSAA
jgi:hypothetical protein